MFATIETRFSFNRFSSLIHFQRENNNKFIENNVINELLLESTFLLLYSSTIRMEVVFITFWLTNSKKTNTILKKLNSTTETLTK